MVDESCAIDTSFIIFTEYHINTFPGEQTGELLLVSTASVHGKRHFVPYLRLPFLVLVFTGVVPDTLFQSLVAVAFFDKRRFDGRTYRLATIIGHRIDNSIIGCSFKFAFYLFRLDIETGEQGAVLAERLETISGEYTLDDIGNLPLHITILVVSLFQIRLQ